jgi:hypothetical protein
MPDEKRGPGKEEQRDAEALELACHLLGARLGALRLQPFPEPPVQPPSQLFDRGPVRRLDRDAGDLSRLVERRLRVRERRHAEPESAEGAAWYPQDAYQLQLLRPPWRSQRNLVPDLKPGALGGAAVECDLPPALGEPPLRQLEARSERSRLWLDAEEAHAPDLRQPVRLFLVQDE